MERTPISFMKPAQLNTIKPDKKIYSSSGYNKKSNSLVSSSSVSLPAASHVNNLSWGQRSPSATIKFPAPSFAFAPLPNASAGGSDPLSCCPQAVFTLGGEGGHLCLSPQNLSVQGTHKSTQNNTPQTLSQDSKASSRLIWEE